MAQLRVWDFGAPRKSQYLNDHFVGIVPTKRIYSGYSVRATVAPSLNLDIKLDGDPGSILMTEEGVRILESTDLPNAVTIAPHATLDRIDYVVAAHQYTNQNNPQTYEVIEGTAGSPPTPPPTVPQYKVLLATVYVPAGVTAITDDMINRERHVRLGAAIGRDGFLELRPDPYPIPTNKVFVNGGTYVNSLGNSSVTVLDDVASAVTFPPVSALGLERIDLIAINDSGVASRVAGSEGFTGTVSPPAYPPGLQVVGEVTIDEPIAAVITLNDIRDTRFFFNIGGGGLSIEREILEFRPDEGSPAINTLIWNESPAILFPSYADKAVWFEFEKPAAWGSIDIDFRLAESPDASGSGSDTVRMELSYWVMSEGETFNVIAPDATNQEDLSVAPETQDAIYWHELPNLRISASDVPAGRCKVIGRFSRNVGVANNFGGGLRLSTLVASL